MPVNDHSPALSSAVTGTSSGWLGWLAGPQRGAFWACVGLSLFLLGLAWFLPMLLVVPPILLGVKTWQRWRQRPGAWPVLRAVAVTGLMTALCLALAGVIWVKGRIHEAARRLQDRENVQAQVRALEGWKAEHGGAYPDDLQALVRAGWLPWPRLISPWHRGKPPPGSSDYQYRRLPDGGFSLNRAGIPYTVILGQE